MNAHTEPGIGRWTIYDRILALLDDGPKPRMAIVGSLVLSAHTTTGAVTSALSVLKARGRVWNPEPGIWQLASATDLPHFLARRPLHLVIGTTEGGQYRAYSPTVPDVHAMGEDPFAAVHALLERIEMALEAGEVVQ